MKINIKLLRLDHIFFYKTLIKMQIQIFVTTEY